MGSSSRPIDHGTNRVGRPNHHTTRIDRREPPSLPYVRLSPHTARTKTRSSISRAFSSTSPPLQSSIKLAPGLRTSPLLVLERFWAQDFLLQNWTINPRSWSLQLKNYKAPSGTFFVYRMSRLSSSRTKEAWLGGARVPTAETTSRRLLYLVSLGLDIDGESL